MNRIKKIIDQLGKKVQINGHNAVAVIYPIRKSKVSGGGIGSSDSGRVDPHLYILFTDSSLPVGTGYGNVVRDEEYEYYILWTDEWKSRAGDYTRICMRKSEVKSVN